MNKLIILIEGYPLQGKSYLADKLHSFYDNSEIIRTDDVLKYFFLIDYPNEFSLINMAYGFDLTYKGESVDQPGDEKTRNVYHFKKKI